MLKVFDVKNLKKTADEVDYELEYISLEDTCCALYVNENSEVLLVKQFRPIIGLYSIEIPGGSKHKGEPVEDAVKREFHEETGLVVKDLEFLYSFYLSVGTSDEKVHIYLVRDIIKKSPLISSEKGVGPFWMDKIQCLKKINNGEIFDAKTIIALQSIFIS